MSYLPVLGLIELDTKVLLMTVLYSHKICCFIDDTIAVVIFWKVETIQYLFA